MKKKIFKYGDRIQLISITDGFPNEDCRILNMAFHHCRRFDTVFPIDIGMKVIKKSPFYVLIQVVRALDLSHYGYIELVSDVLC